jgi:hypothetical protein
MLREDEAKKEDNVSEGYGHMKNYNTSNTLRYRSATPNT